MQLADGSQNAELTEEAEEAGMSAGLPQSMFSPQSVAPNRKSIAMPSVLAATEYLTDSTVNIENIV